MNIIIEFSNNKITSKRKSFKNESCSTGIDEDNYSMISIGDTYETVADLLDIPGDEYAAEYEYTPTVSVIKYIAWYDCNDSAKAIQVTFENDTAIEVQKTF